MKMNMSNTIKLRQIEGVVTCKLDERDLSSNKKLYF